MKLVSLKDLMANRSEDEKMVQYRKLWHLASQFEVRTDFPLHLDIELCGKCNLRCEHCFQNGLIEGSLGNMDEDLFYKVIDEGFQNGLCAIKLQIRGESLLHPKLTECIRYAKNKGVLDIQLTTNAILLNKEMAQKLLTSGLDGLIFSFDDHHFNAPKETVNSSRSILIEKNIRQFLGLRKQSDLKKPWVRLQASLPELSQKIISDTKQRMKEVFPDVDVYAINKIHNFCENIDSYPDLHQKYRFSPCSHLMQRLSVFWNGDVTTCCMDYNGRLKLGNTKSMTIKEAWKSSQMQEYRVCHVEGKRLSMEVCKHCHMGAVIKNGDHVVDQEMKNPADKSLRVNHSSCS
jgi:radical SAM protein with 4Fe4S-binding SPASM domain